MNDEDGYEVKKLTRGPRYCRACENFKPPRAHHCSQCKRYVYVILLRIPNVHAYARLEDVYCVWVCAPAPEDVLSFNWPHRPPLPVGE